MAHTVYVVQLFDGQQWIPARTPEGHPIVRLFPSDANQACADVIRAYAANGIVVHPTAIRAKDYVEAAVALSAPPGGAFGSGGSVGSL